MTTPSKHDGASEQTQAPTSSPSYFKRFVFLSLSLLLVGFLTVSAMLMVPARWSPWLQNELSATTGLHIRWDRFAWRGVGGFQIVNFELRDPDDGLQISIPKFSFGWSIGLSQYPSFRVHSLALNNVAIQYKASSEPEPPQEQPREESSPFEPSEVEALLQAKLIEVQSLAKVLDSLPITIVMDESHLHIDSLTVEHIQTSLLLECRDLDLRTEFLIGPKVNRRRAHLSMTLPRECMSGSDSLVSTGTFDLEATKDTISLSFQSQNTTTYSGSSFNTRFDIFSSLTTDLQTLSLSVREFNVGPFLSFQGGVRFGLGAPAILQFDPINFRLEHKGIPDGVDRLLIDHGIKVGSGQLGLELKVSDVELSSLLTAPLESLKASTSVSVEDLSLSARSVSLRRLRSSYRGELEAGRLLGTHSTTIGAILEDQQGLRVEGIRFDGRDDIVFTAFHGESIEVIEPGTNNLNINSINHSEASMENLALSLRPQLGIDGFEPQWLMAKPRLSLSELSSSQIKASNFKTEVGVRFAFASQNTNLTTSWELETLSLLEPVDGVAESTLEALNGQSVARWRPTRQTLEVESLKQSFGEWGQLTFEDISVDLTRDSRIFSMGKLEAWWKQLPPFAAKILARQDTSLESDGVMRLAWEGELPRAPQLSEGLCKVDALQELIQPGLPRFQAHGEIRLNTFVLRTPDSAIEDGGVRIGVDYDVNEELRFMAKGEAEQVQHLGSGAEDIIGEGSLSLKPQAITAEHSFSFGTFQSSDSEPIRGHVTSGAMEYRFDTSRINGKLSLNNQSPALGALAQFNGDSFGNWLCNSGILEGDLLGLPRLTSSLEFSIGEKNKTLQWDARELEGKVNLKANVVFQEKQIDLDGELEFGNNNLRDPNFYARGITGALPITQRVFYRASGDSCINLPMVPDQLCVVVGDREGVQVGLSREPTIRIAGLTSQELTISRMSAEASYRSGWFGLRDYAAEFLDGDLRGDIYFGINQDLGFDSRFSLKVSDLQLSRLLPKRFRRGKKTRANLVFDAGLNLHPGVSDLNLELAVTRLEADALDALLRALEHKTGLAQVKDARSNLAWIDFRGMNVWIRHEGLNIELDYDPIIIGYRPIPRSLMKRYSLRDWIFEPIIEAQMVPILSDLLGWEARDVL